METKLITVYGGSQPKPGSGPYLDAYKLGALIGGQGWTVLTGGYIGVMEAVSHGAAEAGGHVVGVTCDEIEAWRRVAPNDWIHEERRFKTTRERMFALAEGCDAALALPGGVGTLSEIAFTWSLLQIRSISPRPLILIGNGWQSLIEHFISELGEYIPEKHQRIPILAPNIDDGFRTLVDCLQGGE